MKQPTDTERLDYLEGLLAQKRYSGCCILRWSYTGRGFRLHETGVAAADVEPAAVDQVASPIDRVHEVTHSYLREGRPNLWFALSLKRASRFS